MKRNYRHSYYQTCTTSFRSPNRHILWHSIQHHDREAHLDFLGGTNPTPRDILIQAFLFFPSTSLLHLGYPPCWITWLVAKICGLERDCFYGQSPCGIKESWFDAGLVVKPIRGSTHTEWQKYHNLTIPTLCLLIAKWMWCVVIVS